jgi:hypothetical protein
MRAARADTAASRAVVRTPAYAAQQMPRVIVLEDLHRADAVG